MVFLLSCGRNFFIAFVIAFWGFYGPMGAVKLRAVEATFQKGETLAYHFYYSMVHAGMVTMKVDDQLHLCGTHPCYKIQVDALSGKGLSLFGLKITNKWEAYLDVNRLQPRQFLASIRENDYIREEEIIFDYENNQATSTLRESTRNMIPEVNHFSLEENDQPIKDVLSSYYALRAIDVEKLKVGDYLTLRVLHEKEVYEQFKIQYLGRKKLITKLGQINTLVFSPKLPEDVNIIASNAPVEIFISDDKNKIPIKVYIPLVVGSLAIELNAYSGLNQPLIFQQP